MTLALLVAFGTLGFWLAILTLRWMRVAPTPAETATRALFAAASLSGAYIGRGYPLIWAMLRNLRA
jgi:hypothetical protein